MISLPLKSGAKGKEDSKGDTEREREKERPEHRGEQKGQPLQLFAHTLTLMLMLKQEIARRWWEIFGGCFAFFSCFFMVGKKSGDGK